VRVGLLEQRTRRAARSQPMSTAVMTVKKITPFLLLAPLVLPILAYGQQMPMLAPGRRRSLSV